MGGRGRMGVRSRDNQNFSDRSGAYAVRYGATLARAELR